MADMSAKGAGAGIPQAAAATSVDGNKGMVRSHSSNPADAAGNGPVDLYRSAGAFSYQLSGKNPRMNELALKEIAKTVKAQ